MGVTVQRMVDAEVSGVLFTCNPVSGDPSMVALNASWGLGIGVVGGELTPDDYLVSKITGEVVRRTVSTKHVEYVPDPAGRGTVRMEVPLSGATSRVWAERSSPRWSRSRGASNAITAATRTWSGRSHGRSGCRRLCSSFRRVR